MDKSKKISKNQKKINTSVICWIITEGIRGTENQCLGVAQAMGIDSITKHVQLKQPWQLISPWIYFDNFKPTRLDSDSLLPPWPHLIIAAGRKSIAPALWVKKQANHDCFHVQLQNPYIESKHFDLVVTPKHDQYKGSNVIQTTAGLHKVTPELIKEWTDKLKKQFEYLPQKRIAVLIGGNSKHHKLTAKATRDLCQNLNHLAQDGYGVMVTASRRTGDENQRILEKNLKHPHIYFWDGHGDNPYFAMLGLANTILVTEDSVSMTSEAISTGKPTYIIPMFGGSKRLDYFHKNLRNLGITKPFKGIIEYWNYTPPNDTEFIAKKIHEHLGKRLLKR